MTKQCLSQTPLELGDDLRGVPVRGCDAQARHNIGVVLRKVLNDITQLRTHVLAWKSWPLQHSYIQLLSQCKSSL